MDGIASWLLFLVFLPFLLFFWKMMLMAWKSFLYTNKIKNLSDEIEARQNQLSTVSRSVDANRNTSIGGTNHSRRGSDATLKIDLPPTYEEVMKTFVEAREISTESSSGGAIETRDTHGIVRVQIATISSSDQRSLV